ncbi:hypothetical protein BKA65DRAFT_599484 [Rhexocercosporidium sp. MPI-PUGE-AT-0058]|nr:hypothetical protein BKA65DRAFT_599484 [Rhexocercosporidium sp. MPI-PUGE-AT-0058]
MQKSFQAFAQNRKDRKLSMEALSAKERCKKVAREYSVAAKKILKRVSESGQPTHIQHFCMLARDMLGILHECAGDEVAYKKMVPDLGIDPFETQLLSMDIDELLMWHNNPSVGAAYLTKTITRITVSSSAMEVNPPDKKMIESQATAACPPPTIAFSPKPASKNPVTNPKEDLESPVSECSKTLGNDDITATTSQATTPPAIEHLHAEVLSSDLEISGPQLLDLSLPIEELKKQVTMLQNERPRLFECTTHGTKGKLSVEEKPEREEQTWSNGSFTFVTVGEN